mgnify:FL=1
MDKAKIIENNIIDLKMGLELAEIAENDFLKNYSENRILSFNESNEYLSESDFAKAYAIDLVLFINISSIINDLDNKDYFKSRLIDLASYYPEIKAE